MNGSPGLLDSLVLATDEVRRCVRFDEDGKPLAWQRCSWADVRATRGFQLVELKDPPLAVNVRVGGKSSPPGKAPGKARRKRNRSPTGFISCRTCGRLSRSR